MSVEKHIVRRRTSHHGCITPLKSASNTHSGRFVSRVVVDVRPPKYGWVNVMIPNNFLEGGTKDEMRMFDSQFEALFHGSWPKLGTHELEKCFKTTHFLFLLPKPSFGRVKLRVWSSKLLRFPPKRKIVEGRISVSDATQSAFSKHFSHVDVSVELTRWW